MRFAIIGAGGIGAYLAVKLAQAGGEVALLARGAHLEAIREKGLRLLTPDGPLTAALDAVSDDAEEIGPADVTVFAVKAHQLEAAIAQAAPLLAGGGAALPFQNGVDAPRLLAEAFGPERALIGVAQIFSNITGPGEVTTYGFPGRFIVAGLDGRQDAAPVPEIRAAFDAAGIVAPETSDARVDLWSKFALFNAVSSTTAGARCRLEQVRANPELTDLFRELVSEVAAVARAEGAPTPDDLVERTMAIMANMPGEARASTAHDLEQGRALEVDWIAGAVARLGREHGVPTPASAAVAALLAPWKNGAPG